MSKGEWLGEGRNGPEVFAGLVFALLFLFLLLSLESWGLGLS